MKEQYVWKLSPSKFEASRGCACFREDQEFGKKYKDRGVDLHALVEHEDAPLDGLENADRDAVIACREHIVELRAAAGPFVFEAKELSIDATDRHPRGKLDYLALTKEGLAIIKDWKFGVVEVRPEGNPQFEAYALMAYEELGRRGFEVKAFTVGPAQPACANYDTIDIAVDELPRIEADLKKANERVTDPVKLPDATDPKKCERCAWLHRCPAVVKGVVKFAEGIGLPMPEAFEPGTMATVRDRVIAQDLAVILEGWSKQVKALNREYAIQNGGTLGEIWHISTRGNGVEIQDLPAFVEGLAQSGLIAGPDEIMPFLKIKKNELVEGLASPENPPERVASVVKELEERLGVPRPPVSVFRRGGRKAVRAAEELLDVPQLLNPWAKKHAESPRVRLGPGDIEPQE